MGRVGKAGGGAGSAHGTERATEEGALVPADLAVALQGDVALFNSKTGAIPGAGIVEPVAVFSPVQPHRTASYLGGERCIEWFIVLPQEL